MLRQVLVVEDNDMNRKLLNRMLQNEYRVLQACDGLEAIEILEKEYSNISAIILDIVMPKMNGFEVLEKIKANSNMRQIPVIVATGSDDQEAEEKALASGAIDFVMKPYRPSILKNRLWNTINLREQAAIVNATRTDALTGLYSRSAFFEKTEEMVAEHEAGYYVMACFDIERFKVINDQYGNQKGDTVLKSIAKIFEEGFTKAGGICCRIMADNFAVLYPKNFMNSEEIASIRVKSRQLDGSILPITFSIGRYIVDDLSLTPSAMYDRAAMAKEVIKGRYDEHIALYDESMRNKIISEQEVISQMKQALEGEQFEVWYQPQFNHVTGALVGSEALVRWRHPEKGLISPGLFIPIFEKNGFVYEVDKYVWEQSCKFIKEMQDTKGQIVPISVNISRYDIYRDDLVEFVFGLIKKYKIPVDSLRLEITESAFSKSSAQIIKVVKEFKKLGFIMEIDDFGSGYSSLNTLKDVPADVLKLDMRFLEGTENSDKGGNILESIVRMANWIGMSIIAEGVEEKEQADFLKSIGCYYIQGYFYSKPLPKSDYTKVMEAKACEEKMETMETVDTYDNEAFWDPKSLETLIFNSFVGGACVFEYQNGLIEVIRENDKFKTVLCGREVPKEDMFYKKWEDYISPGSRISSLKAMQKAIQTGKEVVDEMELMGFRVLGQPIYLRAIMRVIAHTGKRYLFYCVMEDITEQRIAEKREKRISLQMETVLTNINGGLSTIIMHEDETAHLLFANDQYYEQRGYTKEQYEKEVTNFFDVVYKEDLDYVKKEYMTAYQNRESFTILHRLVKRDGSLMWVRSKAALAKSEETDDPILINISDDITSEHDAIIKEKETASLMQLILSNVANGITATTHNDKELDFVFANEQFYAIHGYTREQYQNEVTNTFDLIDPQDRDMVKDIAFNLKVNDAPRDINYRVNCRDGSRKWIKATLANTRANKEEQIIQLSVVQDITEEMKEREKRKELFENLPCGAGIYEYKDGILNSIFMNQIYWEQVGRSPYNLKEHPAIDSVKPEDRDRLIRIIRGDNKGEKQEGVIHILGGNGKYIPFFVYGNVIDTTKNSKTIYAVYIPAM